jgi:hypothetical protein
MLPWPSANVAERRPMPSNPLVPGNPRIRYKILKFRIRNLSNLKQIVLMVQILYQNLSKSDPNYYYIGIPKDWSGASDKEVTVIVDDVCVIVPQTIAGATGELIVLRLLEAMMAGDIIDAGDIQKAIEHIL